MQRLMRLSWIIWALLLALAVGAAPKHVILMIGDGMGPDIVAAAGAYKFGPAYHRFGGEKRLSLELPSNHRYVMTYSADGKGYDFTWAGGDANYPTTHATDSAAAATALATGVKTFDRGIGVDVRRNPLINVVQRVQQAGGKTGVITSVPFDHATPAGFAAHNPNRDDYTGLGHEMIFVTRPTVLMGAGNPDAATDPAKAYQYLTREDWDAVQGGKTAYKLVQSREEFKQLATVPPTGPVLGLFRNQNCLVYRNADGAAADPALPTLAEMTAGTLHCLESDNFFLMVEGGAIDWCAHADDLNGTIGETLAFDDAVNVVLQWIAAHGGWEENLLLITADHDTGYLHDVKPAAAGALPTISWGTTGKWTSHANRLVDLYYQGNGSEQLAAVTLTTTDFERGKVEVVDNTAIGNLLNAVFSKPAIAAGK